MIWPTVMRGLSEEYGSWKITWIRRRTARSCRCVQRARGRRPRTRSRRSVGSSSCRMQRPTVVLPQPDSPTRPERLARARCVKLDVVDRAHDAERLARARAAADREVLDEVAHLEQRPTLDAGRRLRPSQALGLPSEAATRGTRAGAVGSSSGGTSARSGRRETGSAARSGSPAAARQVGRQALDGLELRAARLVEPRHRAQQADRVGMARVGGTASAARALLDDARRVHDVDAVGVARDDAEVVRDDDQRDAEPPRQVLHQLEDLRLDRDVERGGRLVGDDQLRIAGERRSRSSRAGACRRENWCGYCSRRRSRIGDADHAAAARWRARAPPPRSCRGGSPAAR